MIIKTVFRAVNQQRSAGALDARAINCYVHVFDTVPAFIRKCVFKRLPFGPRIAFFICWRRVHVIISVISVNFVQRGLKATII